MVTLMNYLRLSVDYLEIKKLLGTPVLKVPPPNTFMGFTSTTPQGSHNEELRRILSGLSMEREEITFMK